jgi:hypothetical protein
MHQLPALFLRPFAWPSALKTIRALASRTDRLFALDLLVETLHFFVSLLDVSFFDLGRAGMFCLLRSGIFSSVRVAALIFAALLLLWEAC